MEKENAGFKKYKHQGSLFILKIGVGNENSAKEFLQKEAKSIQSIETKLPFMCLGSMFRLFNFSVTLTMHSLTVDRISHGSCSTHLQKRNRMTLTINVWYMIGSDRGSSL